MKKQIEQFLNFFRLNNPNVVFVAFLLVFFLDSLINHFTDFPLFVLFMIVALPVMWLFLWVSGHKPVFLIIFISLFVIMVIINNLIYAYGKKNISDLLFILLFATSFYYYRFFHKKIPLLTVSGFLLVSIIMIIPEFVDKNHKQSRPRRNIENKTVKSAIQEPDRVISYDKKNKLNRIEKRVNPVAGFFRVPHIAAYFFGFLSIFYAFLFSKRRKWFYLAISLLTASFVICSGIRSIVFAILLSLFLYLYLQRKIIFSLVSTGFVILVILFRSHLFLLLKKTWIKPYLALLVTLFDNTDRQSRILLWKSWFLEIYEFSWYNYLAGRTFKASRKANMQNIGYKEWFHNDFLSIAFSYGFLCLILYVGLWIIIYRNYSKVIRSNIFIFVFYFSGLFAAFFNGFYYYFPVILLFLFFVMINVEINNPVKQ